MLIGHCIIPDGNGEGGLEEGHPVWDPLRKTVTMLERVVQVGGAAEGARDCWGSPPSRQLARMMEELGLAPLASGGEVGYMRLTTDGKVPHKEIFKEWAEEAPEVLVMDGGSLWDTLVPEKH